MKTKFRSLTHTMKLLAFVPLLCFGMVVVLITSYTIYASVEQETEEGLHNLAYAFSDICSQHGHGDFSMEDGILYRGGEPFDSEFTTVDKIYQVSGVDATLFLGKKRAITSIRNPDGSRATGTEAAPEVVQRVLQKGQEYFSDDVMVNGEPYFGYYVPFRDQDQSIIGMAFVGKNRETVMKKITHAFWLIFSAALFMVVLVGLITLPYSKELVESLKKIKRFLVSIAQGDDGISLDKSVLSRNDEIGEIGRLSVTLNKSVEKMVGTDALTGLCNRRRGIQLLSEAIWEYQQYKIPFTLAMGDIDDFKHINDHYGHLAGDAVLDHLSSLFLEHMGRKGFVVRWGGEEFVFVYERMNQENALPYMKTLLDKIRDTIIPYEGKELSVTMTFGLAEFQEGMAINELIEKADANLYKGKRQGKDQIVQ